MAFPNSSTSGEIDRICQQALITGRVQGVGYRFTTQEQAITLGLGGWVRNLPDGRVEAMVEGDRTQVERLMQWFHNGPVAAKVEAVVIEEQPLQHFKQFEIRRS